MILKFDHVSYSCTKDEEHMVKKTFGEYNVMFEEKALKNIECKKELLHFKENRNHNLTMLVSESKLPVEITAYNRCLKELERYRIGDDYKVQVFSPDVADSENFYQMIGFIREENSLVLKPVMGKAISIDLTYADIPNKAALDIMGGSSIAFWTSGIIEERKKLYNLGIEVTNIDSLMVNNKTLEIFFAISCVGDVVEFIGL